MNDPFDKIHKLLKSGQNRAAMFLLLDKKLQRIKFPYSYDLNHAWFTVGSIFFNKKKYIQAIKAYKKAFISNKFDTESLWAISNCYSELKKPKYSKYYLKKAIAIGGSTNDLAYNLGNAYFDLKQYKEAINQYSKVKKSGSIVYQMAKKNLVLAKKYMTP